MYQVQMQFIPGYNNIWVVQLNPEDTAWSFDIEAEAIAKAEELQAADMSGRQYRAKSLIPVIEEVIAEEVITEETPVAEVAVEEAIVVEATVEEAVVEETVVEEVVAEVTVEETPTEEILTEEPIV